jgi:DNA-directed RNA polymerase I, II, and III subunit RPABC2
MNFEKDDNFDNLSVVSETMSESSDVKPPKYANVGGDIDVDSDDDSIYESDDDNDNDVEIEKDIEDIFKEDDNIINNDNSESDSDDEDEDDDSDEIFEKIDKSRQENIIQNHHPELKTLNYEEIDSLCTVVKNKKGVIIDPLHKTLPILSRYEKARVLGERAEQINSGAQPFIEIDTSMIDGYLIALKELEQKKIPFIIQRPLPNGGCEYWRLNDLEMIS